MTDENQGKLSEDEKTQANECIRAVNAALRDYDGPVRFVVLTRTLAAGIVAYGDTPQEEANVLGALIFDLVSEVEDLRNLREAAFETAKAE